MEVYSAQKPVKPGITLLATTVLLVIAILQAVQMGASKRSDWLLLGDPVPIDPDRQLRVPVEWRELENQPRGSTQFQMPDDDPGAFWVLSGVPVRNVLEGCRWVADELDDRLVDCRPRQAIQMGGRTAETAILRTERFGVTLAVGPVLDAGADIMVLLRPGSSHPSDLMLLEEVAATLQPEP